MTVEDSTKEETPSTTETDAKNVIHEVSERWSEENVQKTATLWELTEQEKANLKLLSQQLTDITHAKNHPSEVVRFLRARSGDIKAAETMFRKSIAWRLETGADTILKDYQPPQVIIDHFPGAVLKGFDKEGDPIYLSRSGSMDVVGLVALVGREEILKYSVWQRENTYNGQWVADYEEKQGRPVRRVTIIEDLNGWAMKTHLSREVISVFGEIMRFDQDNYPETAKRLLIVRAPTVFQIAWALVKHFFDPNVKKKMVFTGYSNFESIIEKYVDMEELPPCMAPQGNGEAYSGFPPDFSGGGPLPASITRTDEPKAEKV